MEINDNKGRGVQPGVVFDEAAGGASASVITREILSQAMLTLNRYRTGKANLERRIIENEDWWKLRHWDHIREHGTTQLKTKSAWLVNVILSKHADAMDAYPEPTCLPREQMDEAEAKTLSAIVPTVLQQNDFELTWSDNWWKKLKAGVGIYGVYWDKSKLNGMGDISVVRVDPLTLYWEPGITDIQTSRNLFHVDLVDNAALVQQYPQLEGKLGSKEFTPAKYRYDDSVDTTDKSPVIDWYYKSVNNGKTVLHYVKFVGEHVLYATEDQPETKERGLYDHGLYPFFFDPLFPEEGTPTGYGYIDICKDAQRQIDLMNNAIVANCIAAATPRWLKRGDDGINEEEYADWTRPFVHVQGSIEESALKPIPVQQLSGNYLSILVSKIDELKETSGNRDVNNGGAPSGVTAASAIAAMQEQSGKLSRDQIQNSYRCYRQVIYCVIELIRQFYDVPRQFRIVGERGMAQYVSFDNRGLQNVPQGGTEFGNDMGMRQPVFDIEVTAAKQSSYSKLSYNELALQLYQLGFFNPQMADQALAALDMMDFKGLEDVRDRVSQNGTMWQQMQMMAMQMQQMAAMLGIDTGAPAGGQGEPTPPQEAKTEIRDTDQQGAMKKKNTIVERARDRANASTQPG